MDRCFMGVDYGIRRTAFSMIGGVEPRIWVDHYGTDYGHDTVLADAGERLATFALAHRPLVIAIESPIVGASKNAQTAVKMAMMAGALAAGAGRGSSGVLLVAPSSWKRAVVGHGNAGKPDVADWLQRHHPELYEACPTSRTGKTDQDAVDSFCLALYAKQTLGG